MATYNLGAVKPWVPPVANHIGTKYNIAVIGGYRSTGSVPNSDHPKGLAIDVMCSIAVGQRIVQDCLANWDAWNISYVIHNRRFYGSRTSNTPYTGPSPHTDHVHISFRATAPAGGINIVPVQGPGVPIPGIPGAEIPIDPLVDTAKGLVEIKDAIVGMAKVLGNIVDFIKFLADPDNWKRVGLALAGVIALLIGFLSFVKGPKVVDLRKVIPV